MKEASFIKLSNPWRNSEKYWTGRIHADPDRLAAMLTPPQQPMVSTINEYLD